MTARPDPDIAIAAWLNDEAPDAAPERLLTASRDRIRSTHQRRAVWPVRGTRPMTRIAFAAAAVVAAVALGGTFFVIQRGLPAFGGPDPSASASPTASEPAVVLPSATPTPSAEASPSPLTQSLELTWSKVSLEQRTPQVAWVGDRFVLVDEDSGVVFTSTDGSSWQALDPDPGYAEALKERFVTWGDEVFGWWNPEDGPDYPNKPPVTARDVAQILRPPAPLTTTTPFEGRIGAVGIGPAGIVARVHSTLLDWDAWVASKLGDDWVSRYEEVSFEDGILEITMKRGRGLKVVWADQGFLPGDFQDAGFGWYSPDGEQWTAIPSFPTGVTDVVGVSDGFIARGFDGMWHSADGITWRNLGEPPEGRGGFLLPWMGGALMTTGWPGHFDLWTSQGRSELPMAADFPASTEPNAPFDTVHGTGPLGLVAVAMGAQEILITRNGIDWDINPMPAQMAADGDGGRRATTVAVGDRSVLVLVWAGFFEPTPSLWLGTVDQ